MVVSVEGNCECEKTSHNPKFIVLTGGPGAGKTAVLEMVKKYFCSHVKVLPEAASILFGGGFLREDTLVAKKSAQKLIYQIQKELELIVADEKCAGLILCDRGSIDGLAYWPDKEELFWETVGSDLRTEMAVYEKVIHLRTPDLSQGYNKQNPIRLESNLEAKKIDERLLEIWSGHPNRIIIESTDNFMEKLSQAFQEIKKEVPTCCLGKE